MLSAQLLTLLADPDRVEALPAAAVPALIGAADELRARLWARLQAGTMTQPASTAERAAAPDRLLSVKEAGELLGVAPRWLYRHSADLPFTRRLSSGALRFSARGLERWKESRR